eukprot:TRINITY_DN4634_c0_g2_i1.p1 TRINITY_DN4634_c0_g2~~TRINITY_DN4634_c0_g2_i1.p1  ORF type:complete len:136 (+),score=14.95 TRINITY_DN4634_c0_g2_i1:79-486(+)
MTKLENMKKVVKMYSIAAALGCAAYCIVSLATSSIPDPKVQWTVLYVYLPILCLAGVMAELGWTKGDKIDKYVHLLNTASGRACLYIFVGCLLFNSGWQILFGILLCAAGALNIITMCKTDKEKNAQEEVEGAVN